MLGFEWMDMQTPAANHIISYQFFLFTFLHSLLKKKKVYVKTIYKGEISEIKENINW